jgi:hypothetical protein
LHEADAVIWIRRHSNSPIALQHKGRKPLVARAPLISEVLYSKIKIAAAMVVVHHPRLSPIADCVTFLVRTIRLEMR